MSLCTMVRGHEGVKPLWVQEFVHAQPSTPLDGTRSPRAFVYVTILFHVDDPHRAGQRLRIAHLGRVAGLADWSHSFDDPDSDWLTQATNSLPRHRLSLSGNKAMMEFNVEFSPTTKDKVSRSFPECQNATKFDIGVEATIVRWGDEPNCIYSITPEPESEENLYAPFIDVSISPDCAGFLIARFAFETNANIKFSADYRSLVYPVLGPDIMFRDLNDSVVTWPENIRPKYHERLLHLRRYQEAIQYETLMAGDDLYTCAAHRRDDGKDYGGLPFVLCGSAVPTRSVVFPFVPDTLDFMISLQAECKESLAPLLQTEIQDQRLTAFTLRQLEGISDLL